MVCMNISKALNLVFDDWQLIEISLLLNQQIDIMITLPPDFDWIWKFTVLPIEMLSNASISKVGITGCLFSISTYVQLQRKWPAVKKQNFFGSTISKDFFSPCKMFLLLAWIFKQTLQKRLLQNVSELILSLICFLCLYFLVDFSFNFGSMSMKVRKNWALK